MADEVVSKHSFLYLFSDPEGNDISKKPNWELYPYDTTKQWDYNLYCYLLPKAKNLFFGGGDKNRLKRFRYKLDNSSSYIYRITEKKWDQNQVPKSYDLQVTDILLLYDEKLCVGILTFDLEYKTSSDEIEKNIKLINDIGRRIYSPSFVTGSNIPPLTAGSITIQKMQNKPDKLIEINFNDADTRNGIKQLSKLIGIENAEPFMDDRMFVLSAIYDSEISQGIQKCNYLNDVRLSKKIYEYCFIDQVEKCSCCNDNMRKELLKNSTYSRWTDLGTLYGITQYSAVCITEKNSFIENVVIPSHIFEYGELARIALFQRAIATKLESEVDSTRKNKTDIYDSDRINDLFDKFIYFQNSYLMVDVTYQDQGSEIFALMQKALKVDEIAALLESEMKNVQKWVDFKDNERMADALNLVAVIGLVFTTVQTASSIAPDSELFGQHWLGFLIGMIVMFFGAWFAYKGLSIIKEKNKKTNLLILIAWAFSLIVVLISRLLA